MSKIANAFKDGKAFIGFLTAGDPTIEKTVEYILAMEEAGCDLIEIGIPFSDPMAEGVVIQDANIRALGHNTTTDDVFEIVRKVRQKTDVPLVFLTYINPVFFYGYEKFFKKCGKLGIDGIISPDLPYEEKGEIKDIEIFLHPFLVGRLRNHNNTALNQEPQNGLCNGFSILCTNFLQNRILEQIFSALCKRPPRFNLRVILVQILPSLLLLLERMGFNLVHCRLYLDKMADVYESVWIEVRNPNCL